MSEKNRKYDYPEIAKDYAAGMTLDECAKKHGCPVASVRQAMKTQGVAPRSRSYRSPRFTPPGRSRRAPKPIYHTREEIKPLEPEKKTYPLREQILQFAIDACARLGGMATIDGRYAIVDTDKVEVKLK